MGLHRTLLSTLSAAVLINPALPACSTVTPQVLHVPLTARSWSVLQEGNSSDKPDIRFIRQEGFPQGEMVIKSGAARLNGLIFRDGTIDFDMKSTAEDIPGLKFRQQGELGQDNAEEFYVRTFPDCRVSNDGIQYTPVINGFMLWNVYPQYQTRAPILEGWNHFKLVVSGRRLNVFVNGAHEPALAVGELESSSLEGSLEFRGPAAFAN